MRAKTKVLAGLVGSACIVVAWVLAMRLGPPIAYGVMAVGVIAALGTVYGFVVRPERQLAFLREVSKRNGFKLVVSDGSPHLMGESDGRAFALSAVSRRASNLLGFETVWIGTWTLHASMPRGFRIHHRSETSWYHMLTGANEIAFEGLSELMIEGVDVEQANDFVDSRVELLQQLFERYPRALVSGADPLNVLRAEDTVSGGTLTIVTEAPRSAKDVQMWLERASEFCAGLEGIAA